MTKSIIELLREANNEVRKFEEQYPREQVFLLQAAEKCWVAFNLLIEKIMEYEMTEGGESVRAAVTALNRTKPDAELVKTYRLAHDLHIYHYEGRTDSEIVKKKIIKVMAMIRNLKERYRV